MFLISVLSSLYKNEHVYNKYKYSNIYVFTSCSKIFGIVFEKKDQLEPDPKEKKHRNI